ncbi:CRISPR-associated protein Cas4 [Tahibacter sp.]|uniref:CRISPR-associated protein Cas4 n=1 Tax=Tahibacter sp. TaxID=2056211 RepID=UPI0028C40208|nr:CRISPR-associated protein Cas4 [Tahibacter sp.]
MDADAIPISALQHWSYCPRQCALIHVEQAFVENVHTLRGRAVHSLVDQPGIETLPGRRVERSMPLWCERLGLVGKGDVVEFLPDGTPFPVEYKHGKRRSHRHDELQLAAQAICLEEMTGRPVVAGALYHHGSRRRREVAIDATLRDAVTEAVLAIRSMLAAAVLPPPVDDARCRQCSMQSLCQPRLFGPGQAYRHAAGRLFEISDE